MKGITKVISVLFFERHRYSLSVCQNQWEKKKKKSGGFFLTIWCCKWQHAAQPDYLQHRLDIMTQKIKLGCEYFISQFFNIVVILEDVVFVKTSRTLI